MDLIFINILTDFCASWFLWWILPFLLGILLGSILWRKYKAKYDQHAKLYNAQKAEVENLRYQLRKIESENETRSYELERLKSKYGDLDKRYIEQVAKTKALTAEAKAFSQVKQTEKQALPLPIIMPLAATDATETSKGVDKSTVREKSKKDGLQNDDLIMEDIHKDPEDKSKQKGKTELSDGKADGYPNLVKTNLQIIEGIGPRMEAILKESGISNWQVLSRRSSGELRALLDKFGGRYKIVDPTEWPLQALHAEQENWTKLIELQTQDGSSSKFEKILKKLGYNK